MNAAVLSRLEQGGISDGKLKRITGAVCHTRSSSQESVTSGQRVTLVYDCSGLCRVVVSSEPPLVLLSDICM